MSELENIENVEQSTGEVSGGVSGEVSGEVTEVTEDEQAQKYNVH